MTQVAGLLRCLFILLYAVRCHNIPISGCNSESCNKVLCLHGGGMNGESMQKTIHDIVSKTEENFRFYFPTAPYGDNKSALWIPDPPGGKSTATTDKNWDSKSLQLIDTIVETYGPFYAVLGYSQGTAAAISYISQKPGTFQMLLAFCAYLPTTHVGITERINSSAPYNMPAYVYMGKDDYTISNCLTNQFAAQFTKQNTTRATNPSGGHSPPLLGEKGFNAALTFLNANHSDGSYTPPPISDDEMPDADCESASDVLFRLYWWVLLLAAAVIIWTLYCCCKLIK